MIDLEAGIAAAKGLLGAEIHPIQAGHRREAPVVGGAAEVPLVTGDGLPDHHADAAAGLGPLIVGDRQAIGEGARLAGVDDYALRALAVAPEVAGDLAIGIGGVAAAQGQRRPQCDSDRAARADDRQRRLVVIPQGGDAVGLRLIIDLEADSAGPAPEDVAAAGLQHPIGVAVAEAGHPVPRLIELEPLVGLAIQIGLGLPQVIGHQLHGHRTPAVEGATHLQLRPCLGEAGRGAAVDRRGGDRLVAGVDVDPVVGVGTDRIIGRRVTLLPVAVSVDLEARAAAGIPALEQLTAVVIDAVGRDHGSRRPSIGGATEEPLRRHGGRRYDERPQQAGSHYPSSH
ncbi:hypothetical protein D3C78_1047890 [compost metagenome]